MGNIFGITGNISAGFHGVQQGIDRTRRLTQLLLADGRQDNLVRSTTDAVFMKRLFKEYGV